MTTGTTKSDILSQIVPLERHLQKSLKFSIYGNPKTGKTRLAATFPKPLLIFATEDGTASIRGMSGISVLPIKKSSTITEALSNDLSQFKTLVLDTASVLSDIILSEITGNRLVIDQKSWGSATREQYGQLAVQMKILLRRLLSFPGNVVILSHEKNFGGDDEGISSDLITPVISMSLTGSVARWLGGQVDYICQTFIRQKEVVVSQKIGNQTIPTRKTTNQYEYCLRTGPHPIYTTGFRVGIGNQVPEVIVDPTYEKIRAVIEATTHSKSND